MGGRLLGISSRRLVLGVTLGLLIGPVLADLALSPLRRPFGYVAADTFYYLTIARNIVRHGTPSFDGVTAINGFHPVWQLITAAIYLFLDLFGATRHIVLGLVLVELCFVAAAVVLLGRALSNRDRHLTPTFALLPVGAYALTVAPTWLRCAHDLPAQNPMEGSMPLFGTLWSYMNGMESGPVLFFFAWAACSHQAWRQRSSIAAAHRLGAALSLLTLSRLDHALLALPIAVATAASAWRRAETRRHAVPILAWFGIPVLLYALSNHALFGSAMPVSGALKSTFPMFSSEHLQHVKNLLAATGTPVLAIFMRESQIFIPLLTAFAYLAVTLRARHLPAGVLLEYRPSIVPFEHFLAPAAAGVIGLGLYNALYVPIWGQGTWYFPVSTLFVSLAVIAVLDRSRARLAGRFALPALVAWSAFSIWFFLTLHRHTDYHERYATLYWDEAPKMRARLGRPLPRLLEVDDGIVNYSLDLQAMSNGLALDPQGALAYRENRLFRLAVERGFDRVTTLVYASAVGFQHDASPEAARRWVQQFWPAEDLSAFEFNVDYVSPSGLFALVAARKR